MQESIKKNRRKVLMIILFFALFFAGQEIYQLLEKGIDEERNVIIQLSGLLSFIFISLGSFWELFIGKGKKTY